MTWKCAFNAWPKPSESCNKPGTLEARAVTRCSSRVGRSVAKPFLEAIARVRSSSSISQSVTDATRRARDVTRVLQCVGVKIAVLFPRDALQVFVAAGVERHRGFLQKMESGEQRLTFSCCRWPLHGAGRALGHVSLDFISINVMRLMRSDAVYLEFSVFVYVLQWPAPHVVL